MHRVYECPHLHGRPTSANGQKLKASFLRIGRRRVRDKRYELRKLSTGQEKDIYLEGADLKWEDFQRLEGVKILAITKDMLGYLVQRAESFKRSLMRRVTLMEVDEATQMTEGDQHARRERKRIHTQLLERKGNHTRQRNAGGPTRQNGT